ncbi:MAG: MurR/RpiR family transcriptional regulator [Firmicutes bacterium]|nr:MurR/RpiR family transcriptional regulator [Bacillota bacterium]
MVEGLDATRRRLADMGQAGPEPTARVAAWLAAHLPEVAWRTVAEVARAAEVSPATVVRTAQRAGYRGYPALQAEVRAHLPSSELVWKLRRAPAAAQPSGALRRVVEQEKNNLDQLALMPDDTLAAFVDMLAAARRVYVVASLASVPLGEYVALHLGLILGNVRFAEPSTVDALAMLAEVEADDLVVGLSFPRYARATLETIAACARKGCRTVVITDRSGPGLPEATMVLKLPARSATPFSSSVSLMAVTAATEVLLHERLVERVEANMARVDRTWSESGVLLSSRRRTGGPGAARGRERTGGTP